MRSLMHPNRRGSDGLKSSAARQGAATDRPDCDRQRTIGFAAAILTVFLAGGPRATHDMVAAGGLQAKLGYCKDCHGPSAQGYHGYFPIPRLAGQQTEYLENQLRAFIEHRRTNNIMFNVAHALSPA